jgi:hypothetical protein
VDPVAFVEHGFALRNKESVAWEARIQLLAADYRREFGRLTGQGYRPVARFARAWGDVLRYAAVWPRHEARNNHFFRAEMRRFCWRSAKPAAARSRGNDSVGAVTFRNRSGV